MYLPALLVRDYGIWAFVVFAVPNVIGAAAMAWVLPDAEASRAFQQKHLLACKWFSFVTILFHCYFFFFAMSLIEYPIEERWPIAIFVFFGLLARLRGGGIIFAIAATAYSGFIAYTLWHVSAIPRLPPPVPPSMSLIWIGMVCAFGLSLCPYLDLTFHQARQATTPGDGRAAFAIGFGVFFFAAILFTLAYSYWIVKGTADIVLVPLGSYLLVQTILKISLHSWAALSRMKEVGVVALAFLAILVIGDLCTGRGLTEDFEDFYRCFLVFYALVFPAYVWICIFGKKSPRVWIAAVLIAAPMYWMGFIERQMIWLLPGVAVPVLVGLLPFRRVRPPTAYCSPSA